MKKFRNLKSNEIECRVAQIAEKWLSLLLYKDARCDMNILDEEIGIFNWQRHHTRDNANCIVSIKNEETGEWISKEDTGAESFTEKEKGLASDSFKRACFNWGIGRELYTAPSIFIKPKNDKEFYEQKGRYKTRSKFKVSKIEYDNDYISYLVITDQDGTTRFKSGISQEDKENGNVQSDKPTNNEEMLQQGIEKGRVMLESLCNKAGEDAGVIKAKFLNNHKWSSIKDITFKDNEEFKQLMAEVKNLVQINRDEKEVGF